MPRSQMRYGVAELFGKSVDKISAEEKKLLLEYSLSSDIKKYPTCPFRLPSASGNSHCSKKGGVCSLRQYVNKKGLAERVSEKDSFLVVTCPFRLHQDRMIFQWVASELLSSDETILVKEIGFLKVNNDKKDKTEKSKNDSDRVGSIDMILVDKSTLNSSHLSWCALELQAVYFSGPGMESEFKNMLSKNDRFPFPCKIRRPDYRSSAPKRLMPQLQIKVPALRRWGKKMAVVVDRLFFEWMGRMESSGDITSSDIIWFVVDFVEEEGGVIKIKKHGAYYTTLERAVEGLTGGTPVTLNEFENSIKTCLKQGVTL